MKRQKTDRHIWQGRSIANILVMLMTTLLAGGLLAAQDGPTLTEAEIFFELNNTDGDLGLHLSIDGGPYRLLSIRNPRNRLIFAVAANGSLARQGLTQLMLESAEPNFDDLSPDEFFARFPEGEYRIEARTQSGGLVTNAWFNFLFWPIFKSGQELESTVHLSHVLAAPPENVLLSGVPLSEDCDENVPVVTEPILVEWDPVLESHPELGRSGPVEIVLYQLFIGDFSVDLEPDVTEFLAPTGFLPTGEPIKFEIIARTSTGNNTAVESCFMVREP